MINDNCCGFVTFENARINDALYYCYKSLGFNVAINRSFPRWKPPKEKNFKKFCRVAVMVMPNVVAK